MSEPTAANETVKKALEPVLHSMATKRQRRAKGSQKEQFAVGLAVGCLALAAIGGGLVATGRLRLKTSSPAPSAVSDRNSFEVGALAGGNRRSTVETPAANSAGVPGRQQPKAPRISQSSAPTPNSQAVADGQRSVVESVKSSASQTTDQSRAVQPAVNQPLATPGPSISVGTAAPQPEAVTGAPAPAMQSPTAAAEALPLAQPEAVEQAREPRPDAVSEPSAPVLSSPDPETARPSSLEPAKLLVHIQPVYPLAARLENVQGSVEVVATIGKDGVPRGLRATRGDSRLAAAAIAAISGWRYKPAMVDGRPEATPITIIVNFTP